MAEPTLGEITGIQGNAALGDASTGVTDNIIPQNSQELGYLSALMDAKQKAADFIAQQHQQNLQSTLTNFNNIDLSKVYAPDYKDLTDKYRDLTSNLYDNYDVIANPMKNPQLYAQLMGQESELRGAIAQSQSHNVVDQENQKLLDLHPEFNTPQNLQALQNFRTTPLGTRTIPNLQAPTLINPAAIVKAATDQATQQIASSVAGKKFISNQTVNSTDPDQWYSAVKGALNTSNGFGGTWNDALAKQYNQLPPAIKQSENYDQFLKSTFPVPKSYVSSASTSANPYGLQSLSEANQIRLAGLNHTYTEEEQNNAEANAEKLAKVRGEIKEETNPNKQGTSVNTQVGMLFNTANDADKTISYYTNGKQNTMNVLNIPEDQRKLFGYQSTNEFGKKTLIVPDLLARLPGGRIQAIYYSKDASGKLTYNDGKTRPDGQQTGGYVPGGGYASVDMAHTQDFTPDNIRDVITSGIDPKQREKVRDAAIAQAPSLNDPVVLKKYIGNSPVSQPDNTPTSVTVKTETPNFMLPKQINSQTDYDVLKSGDQYIAPDGKVYIKK